MDNMSVVSNKAELKTILSTRETEGLANINPLMYIVGRRILRFKLGVFHLSNIHISFR